MPELGTSSVDVGMLPAAHATLLWPQIEQLLHTRGKRFLDVFSEEELFQKLAFGQIDAWCGMDEGMLEGVALCAWEVHARRKYYHIVAIFGRGLKKYLTTGMDKIEKYACIMGAAEVVMDGDRAWTRILGPRGYGSRTVRLRKSVQTLWR